MGERSHNNIRRSACPANARSSKPSLTFRPSPKSRKTLCAMAMTFSSRRSRPDGPLPAADHRRSPRSLAYPRMSRVQAASGFQLRFGTLNFYAHGHRDVQLALVFGPGSSRDHREQAFEEAAMSDCSAEKSRLSAWQVSSVGSPPTLSSSDQFQARPSRFSIWSRHEMKKAW